MIKINSYSAKGTKQTDVVLPKEYEEKPNNRLLSQSIRVYLDRSHPHLASTKTRSEVSRTKKKAYRQKGTGGARHGAKSAPIFVGGGKAHGPKPYKRELKLSANMKKKSLNIAISTKAKKGDLVLVQNLSSLAKTKDAQKLIDKVAKGQSRISLVLKDKKTEDLLKAFSNLEGVKLLSFPELNSFSVYLGGFLVFDKGVFEKEKTPKTKSRETKK